MDAIIKKHARLISSSLNELPTKQVLLSLKKNKIIIKNFLSKNLRNVESCTQEIVPGNHTHKNIKNRLDSNKKPILFIVSDKTTIRVFGTIDVTDVQAVIAVIADNINYYILSIGDRLNEGCDDVISIGDIPYNSPYGKKITACVNFFENTARLK